MGKRKSSRKPIKKAPSEPLPSQFNCLFCDHIKSVEVTMDRKIGIGYLECRICQQRFQCGITYLMAPVDVFAEWVDASVNAEGYKANDSPRDLAQAATAMDEEDDYAD